jgi:hypothetical protein
MFPNTHSIKVLTYLISIFVLIALLVDGSALAGGGIAPENASNDWLTYTNPIDRYQFKHPLDWIPVDFEGHLSYFIGSGIEWRYEMPVSEVEGHGDNLDEIIDWAKEWMKDAEGAYYYLDDIRHDTLGTNSFVEIPMNDRSWSAFYIMVDNRIFATEAKVAGYEKTIRQILSSIQLYSEKYLPISTYGEIEDSSRNTANVFETLLRNFMSWYADVDTLFLSCSIGGRENNDPPKNLIHKLTDLSPVIKPYSAFNHALTRTAPVDVYLVQLRLIEWRSNSTSEAAIEIYYPHPRYKMTSYESTAHWIRGKWFIASMNIN